jgi:hypothetical protein
MIDLFRKKKVTETLHVDDKIYYPSTTGMALIAEVKAISDKDVVVRINGKEHYLQKESVDDHAVVLKATQAKMFVSQRIEDPDNDIVYYRLTYNETWIDKLYNWYCRLLGRPTRQIIEK